MKNKRSRSNQNKAHFPATKRLVEGRFRTLGRLEYVFNRAGIGIVGKTRLYELGDWNHVLDVNLRGVVMACRPHIRSCSGGALVTLQTRPPWQVYYPTRSEWAIALRCTWSSACPILYESRPPRQRFASACFAQDVCGTGPWWTVWGPFTARK